MPVFMKKIKYSLGDFVQASTTTCLKFSNGLFQPLRKLV